MSDLASLPQAWPKPGKPRPIVCLGAGGIVENAHLPAYARIGLSVAALYDIDLERARRLAARFDVARVAATLGEAVALSDAVFDVAVPARAVPEVLEQLPERAAVLIQKPMGESLGEASRILEICRRRSLTAAINFQLRFSPAMLALGALVKTGRLGQIVDFEVRVNVHTPWELWPFLAGIPRHEVLYHSVHYLDLARAFLGEPSSVLCRAVRHPELPAYSDTRSATVLDYGDRCRALVAANHAHHFGRRHQMSELKLEGTRGAAIVRLGVNLDYPRGEPDRLEVWLDSASGWQEVPLRGSWFTEAFEGPISNLQRFAAGEDRELLTGVDDAIHTMALLEACYASSAAGGARPV